MGWDIPGSGVPAQALRRYVEEQLFTLPGTQRPREELTVLLTGSRAFGAHGPGSDVDLEVVCPCQVWDTIQRAMLAAGRTRRAAATFYPLEGDDWDRYYGREMGRPHFSLTPLEEVGRHFAECDDVWIWIWQAARIVHDPADQFGRVRDAFSGYPPDLLVRKIKYRWMLAAYWGIEVYPQHPAGDRDLMPASMAIVNAVAEFQRFFFLVEGRPFPYAEKLPAFVGSTRLGREFGPFLQRAVNLTVGHAWPDRDAWERLREAGRLLFDSDTSPECCCLEEAAYAAMLAAGVEPDWVAADFRNIDELLQGRLGPMP